MQKLRLAAMCLASVALPLAAAAAAQLPQFDPTRPLPAGTVVVYRDQWGMAHIYAHREEDGFLGLGYASAQDRLHQILLSYLMVRGELAAHFGAAPLKEIPGMSLTAAAQTVLADPVASDRTYLLARYLEDARNNLPRMSRQFRSDMQRYIDGLQLYMQTHPAEVPAWAPRLEPALPLALLTSDLFGERHSACASSIPAPDGAARLQSLTPLSGSNAWALGRSHTPDSEVLFAADSHGAIAGVGGPVFHSWTMHTPTLNTFALELTGTAVPTMGHSDAYAWGWTEGKRITADCYAIKTYGNEQRQFLYDGHPRRIEVEPYRVQVKGGQEVSGQLEFTRHNGVRSPVVRRVGDVAYVMTDTYAGRAGWFAQLLRDLAAAGGNDQLRKLLERRDWYPANLIVGGKDGTILYARPGRNPRRAAGVDPAKVLDGNASATAWRGLHPFADAVQLWNPPQDFVSNSNISPDMMFAQRVLEPARYPKYFAFEPGRTNTRQRRLIELLEHARDVTPDRATAIVFDTRVPDVDKWGPAIARALASGTQSRDVRWPAFAAALTGFDGDFTADSLGAKYYLFVRLALRNEAPQLTDALTDAVESGEPLSAGMLQALAKSVHTAFDQERETPPPCALGRTFGDMFRIAAGSVDLPASGSVFPLHLKDDGLGEVTVHTSIYGSRPGSCQRQVEAGTRAPFLVHFGARTASRSALLWGESEDLGSRHGTDQVALISERRLRPDWFQPEELRSHIVAETVLRPGKAGVRVPAP